MTLSSAKARFELSAVATPTGVNVVGPVTVGETIDTTSWSTADYIYSFKVTANAASDVATLVIDTGQVSQTTGSPVLLNHNEDFEGNALVGALSNVLGIMVKAITCNGTITVAGTAGLSGILKDVGSVLLWAEPTGSAPAGTLTLTFTDAGDAAEVVNIAKE